jgi:hypothetical protein
LRVTGGRATRDGKRLLVRQPAGPQEAGLSVILNWPSKLK